MVGTAVYQVALWALYWVGGWVGGLNELVLFVYEKVEEIEAVGMRYCELGVGGWVEGTYRI